MATNESFIRSNICEDCFRLVRDVLSGNTSIDENWTTLSSEYAKLSIAKHLDGSIESLQKSKRAGCILCGLISCKLPQSFADCDPKTYSIIVWQENTPKLASKARLHIVAEPVETFIKHVSDWRRPPCLVIFGQKSISLSSKRFGKKTKASAPVGPTFFSLLPASHHASPENFYQAEKWLEECRNNHPRCLRGKAPLPKRIVRIQGSEENMKISLCVTNGELRRYTAISYSWGENDRIVTQQSPQINIPPDAIPRNGTYVIEQRNCSGGYPLRYKPCHFRDPDNIPLAAFPATLKDAILIAHRLNFEYIWIDSLCIIQDSNSDWDDQVAKLTYIYSGADFVISAAHAETSISGILNEIPNDRTQIGQWLTETNTYDIFVGDPLKTLDLERKYISTRGWIFQERLVSTASLHYTDEGLVWECVHGIQVSHDQGLPEVTWKKEWRDLLEREDSSPSDLSLTQSLVKTPNEIWYNWIRAYSERTFYEKSDKLPAIAGMAQRFAETFRLTYIAGLWKEDFALGLTWKRHNRTPTLIRYRDKYVAPSWSWASVQGRLEYRNVKLVKSSDERKGPELQLLHYNVKELRKLRNGKDSYGALEKGATIKVSGLLGPITLDLHHRPGVRSRDFQHCGVFDGFINNDNVICTLDEHDTSLPMEEVPRYYKCWCLRIGSYEVSRITEADMFLLLNREKGKEEFHRVGFAETDPNFNNKGSPLFSGMLNTPREATTVTIT